MIRWLLLSIWVLVRFTNWNDTQDHHVSPPRLFGRFATKPLSTYGKSKCQSWATLTTATASSLKTIQSHNPPVKTNSTRSQMVVRVLDEIGRVPVTARPTLPLTGLTSRRGLLTLLRLTRIGHGSGLLLRHSDRLTTWLFMTNNCYERQSTANERLPIVIWKSCEHVACRILCTGGTASVGLEG